VSTAGRARAAAAASVVSSSSLTRSRRHFSPPLLHSTALGAAVAATGEFARVVRDGLGAGNATRSTWWRRVLLGQLMDAGGRFSRNGVYEDHSGAFGVNPAPYGA
jgi:hypothetical protein